jgi:hypothetical protein
MPIEMSGVSMASCLIPIRNGAHISRHSVRPAIALAAFHVQVEAQFQFRQGTAEAATGSARPFDATLKY